MAENMSSEPEQQARPPPESVQPPESPGSVTVRAARVDDMPRIHTLIHELAAYEGVPDGPRLSVQDLVRDGFECPSPWFFAVVAERGGQLVGYALCNRAYSSWTCRALYIEDLYVVPDMRRAGIGMKILQHLCQMSLREDVHRIDWHVLDSNAPALAFYDRLGARDLRRTERRAALRLDRHRIEAVAGHRHHHAPPS
ncbi:thialysine N-epsilon-acetyltransferase-like [Achroia grisella]|uniref:thialysine N-epsilon-acetyltransferase-like n=1 Tax=Achroia grisella TaxID=688607 RepID=UPI0027D2BAF0|nr:thialysine N-epsilon-acetyltransferase-like [Achroia grisella]